MIPKHDDDLLARTLASAQARAACEVAHAEQQLATLRTTLADLIAAKPVRAEYPHREIWLAARLLHRTGVADLREAIRRGEEELAIYAAALASTGPIDRQTLN